MKRAHVIVHGKVQGVWFRAHTKGMADRLGVGGWVRNLPDGTVEAVFEGDDEKVEEMVKWCHEGSPMAEVTRVDVEYEKPKGEKEFIIRYD
jgi:acylphosphatase